MTNKTVFAVILSVLIAWASTAQDARAQAGAGGAEAEIAVISIERIRRDAAAVKDITSQISAYRSAFQKDIKKEEEELRTADQELARKRSVLSKEAFNEERRKFEESLVKVQRLIQARKRNLDKVRGDAMKKVQDVLGQIITDVAKERNLKLILSRNQVVFSAENMDLTSVVLERLDKQLPKMKVAAPGNP